MCLILIQDLGAYQSMAQSDNKSSLSLFSAYEQVKTTLEAIEQAEEQGHGMLVDQYISDFYAILKEAEGGTDRCIGFIQHAESYAAAIDEEIQRLQNLKKSKERAAERVKQLALAYMDITGQKTLEGQFGRKFTKVETTVVIVTALDQLEDSLKRVTTVIEPNKKAIKDKILEIGSVPGATLAINSHVRVR